MVKKLSWQKKRKAAYVLTKIFKQEKTVLRTEVAPFLCRVTWWSQDKVKIVKMPTTNATSVRGWWNSWFSNL